MILVDRSSGIGSPDHCDTDRPDLAGPRFLGSAGRTGGLILFRDAMTGRTRFLGELHFSSLMTLAVSHRRGERCEEPRVVMGAEIEHKDFTVLALYLVPRSMIC